MWRSYRLLFGPLAAILLFFGIVGLGLVVPGYSQVRQTVSEIGEMGSPAQIPFAILLVSVSACVVVFAMGVRDISSEAGRSSLPAYVIGFMALSVIGVGVFAYPHPLHGIFGLSELIGDLAPLILALTWRRDSRMSPVVGFSWVMTGLLWISIALNLSSFNRHAAIFTSVQPFYGLVQRSLFVLWFGWCAVVGVMLFRGNGEFDRKR